MGQPPAYDPIAETEYLVEADLADAERRRRPRPRRLDLRCAVRTASCPGIGVAGPRVLDFAPAAGHERPAR